MRWRSPVLTTPHALSPCAGGTLFCQAIFSAKTLSLEVVERIWSHYMTMLGHIADRRDLNARVSYLPILPPPERQVAQETSSLRFSSARDSQQKGFPLSRPCDVAVSCTDAQALTISPSDTSLYSATHRALLDKWNETQQSHPSDMVHDLFERACENYPDAIALETADESLSYSALNKMANKIAHKLRSLVRAVLLSQSWARPSGNSRVHARVRPCFVSPLVSLALFYRALGRTVRWAFACRGLCTRPAPFLPL